MPRTNGKIVENFAAQRTEKYAGLGMNAPALAIDTNDYTTIVRDCLHEHFGRSRSAIKEIARAANCNERAAENWWLGKNGPGGLHLLRLAAQVPNLQSELRRLMAMDAEHDAAFMRDFITFKDIVARHAERVMR